MALTLSTISSAHKSSRKRKRVGRGNASSGTYSGRGLKGQKARSGVSGLKRLGLKMTMRGLPKKRGFTPVRIQETTVTLETLSRITKDLETITPRSLVKAGIISKIEARRVKIVGSAKLSKKLTVKAHGFSEAASSSIMNAGGTASLIQK